MDNSLAKFLHKKDIKINYRIIPKLDIKGPNLIKGIQFDGHRVLGTAEEFSEIYYLSGADELIYQDSVASLYNRNSLLEIVKKTSNAIFIPLTVGGGIRTINDIRSLLLAGADKVSINTASIKNPSILYEGAKKFGSQCIVSGIDAYRKNNGDYEVWVDYGREPTGINVFEWAKEVESLGAGEILLNSINRDGMGTGYDIELTNKISSLVKIPIIAAGGAGGKKDLIEVLNKGNASAISASSIFHYFYATPQKRKALQKKYKDLRMGKNIDSGNLDFLRNGYGGEQTVTVSPISIKEVKTYLKQKGINVRQDSYEK